MADMSDVSTWVLLAAPFPSRPSMPPVQKRETVERTRAAVQALIAAWDCAPKEGS